MTRPIKDTAAQKAYEAQKNAKKNIAVKEKLEAPGEFWGKIQKIVKEKFSAEDIDKIKQINVSLKKYQMTYQGSLSMNNEAQNISTNQEKVRSR